MSKIFKVYHRECKIENKIYHITTKYDFSFRPLEIVIKERKTKKIIYKIVVHKGKEQVKVYSKIDDLVLLKLEKLREKKIEFQKLENVSK